MYFVEQGVVVIKVYDDSGKEVEINRINKGGYFGELALVTHRPRAASAYAEGDVKLACMFFYASFSLFDIKLFFCCSPGCGGVREIIGAVHAIDEA